MVIAGRADGERSSGALSGSVATIRLGAGVPIVATRSRRLVGAEAAERPSDDVAIVARGAGIPVAASCAAKEILMVTS